MKTLYSIVTYNYSYYHELTNEDQRREIEKLIEKLQHLAHFIIPVTEGRINISPTGNIFIDNYPKELANQIRII